MAAPAPPATPCCDHIDTQVTNYGCSTSTASLPSSSSTVSPPASLAPESITSRPGEIDPAFKARANTVCKPYADFTGPPVSLRRLRPANPDVAQLPQVGAFFDANPSNHSLVADLNALGDPTTGAAGWRTVLSMLQQQQDIGQAQIASAKKSDVPGFVATVKQNETTTLPLDVALLAAGFTFLDPCDHVS